MPTRNVVTTAPRNRRTKVAHTVSTAQRCNHRGSDIKLGDVLFTFRTPVAYAPGSSCLVMTLRGIARLAFFGLRFAVFVGVEVTVFIRPAVYHRHGISPVAMRGGRGRGPF